MFKRIFKMFLARQKKKSETAALQFDGLSPMLARQLSEVEGQIGNLLEAQFRISEERERMRSEMESLILTLKKENAQTPIVDAMLSEAANTTEAKPAKPTKPEAQA